MEEARKIAKEHGGQISTSFLQRRLQIGYPRAARLKELLDEEFEKEEKQARLRQCRMMKTRQYKRNKFLYM